MIGGGEGPKGVRGCGCEWQPHERGGESGGGLWAGEGWHLAGLEGGVLIHQMGPLDLACSPELLHLIPPYVA